MARPTRKTSYWGQYGPPAILGMPHPTAFELKCKNLNLSTFDEQFTSPELRKWVHVHMRQYYVPEKLLKAWNFYELDLD